MRGWKVNRYYDFPESPPPPPPPQPPATYGPVHAVDGVRSSEVYEREVDLSPPHWNQREGGRSDPWRELSCILTRQNIQKLKLYTKQKLYTNTMIRFNKKSIFLKNTKVPPCVALGLYVNREPSIYRVSKAPLVPARGNCVSEKKTGVRKKKGSKVNSKLGVVTGRVATKCRWGRYN